MNLSKAELIPQYQKLNFLASSLAPNYSKAGYMQGNLAYLTYLALNIPIDFQINQSRPKNVMILVFFTGNRI